MVKGLLRVQIMNHIEDKAKSIFLAAVERHGPLKWTAYVDEACAGDEALRRRVEVLLRAHAGPDSLFDDSAPGLLATVDDPVTEKPGTVIDEYKLLEQIGEGGMGLVFVAEQERPVRRKVALKVIKPGMDTRQVVARFEAERQALALMDHPNIAKVHDGGETAGGRPYFVMELVKGVPITQYCDENRLTPRERLELFLDVCQAVQHAHQKGIIHRDIKPSNVLIASHDGVPVVKIIDFGVAKAVGQHLTERTLYTHFTQLIGTPLYMSPEQAGQSALDVDTRSDIYSLGVLLYELLTGTTPFDKERFKEAAYDEIRRIIREEEPPKPSTRISTLGQAASTISAHRKSNPKGLSQLIRGELDWIVMRCLEKDRKRRYETASALGADVQHYLHDEPVQACPPSPGYRLRKFARRNKLALVTAGLVFGALIVGAAVSCYFAVQANDRAWEAEIARDRATTAEAQIREDRDRILEAERIARVRQAAALVGQAHGTRLSRRPGQRFEALDALGKAAAIGRELRQPPEWFDRLRNEAIAALALPDIHITQEFPPGTVTGELSDDFELYVATTDKGGCLVRRVADQAEVARTPGFGEPVHASFGRDHLLGMLGKSGRFQLWDVSGPQAVLRLEQEKGIAGPGSFEGQFRPDGKLLALSRTDGSVSIHDVASGARLGHVEPVNGRSLDAAPHPTEPLVAVCGYNLYDMVRIYDWRKATLVAEAKPPWPGGSTGPAWSPDGRTLVVAQGDGGTGIQEYAFDSSNLTLRPIRTLEGSNRCSFIAYNRAGDRFISRGWDEKIDLFDAVSGRLLFKTQRQLLASHRLRFDRTGQCLAAARVGDRNDRIGLWSVADAREYRALVLSAAGETVGEPAFHPSGRLAAIGLSQGVALFDLETGHQLTQLPALQTKTRAAFDGAGDLLTNGFEGFFRWPVRPDPANPGRLVLGPAKRLPFQPGRNAGSISASRDGRVIAQCMWSGHGEEAFAGGWILHPNSSTPRNVAPGTGKNYCSVSPDGRWVAFGRHGDPINVYDAATGQRVWQSPASYEIEESCRFTPDGRWLVTSMDGGRLYTVGTWERGPQLGPGIPWDVTSDLAVLSQRNGVYRLADLTTGRELARLEDPEQNARGATFTPDDTKLVVAAKDGLRVWDLRRIRQELRKLDLDWAAAAYSPAAPPFRAASPLEVTFELGDLSGREKYTRTWSTQLRPHDNKTLAAARLRICLSQWDEAATAYTRLDWSGPLHDDAFEYACLFLVRGEKEGYAKFCREMIQRAGQSKDPYEFYVLARTCAIMAQGVVDAGQVVEWAKQAPAGYRAPWFLHALGLAQYRAGQFEDALQSFNEALGGAWSQRDLCWFGLALVHQRLGHVVEARKCRDNAIQWLARVTSKNPQDPVSLPPPDWLAAQLHLRELIADRTTSIERDPNNAQAWNNWGSAYSQLHQYDKAIADYSKAIELDSKYAVAWNNRAAAYINLRQWDKAAADYDKLLELQPTHRDVWFENAYLRLKQGDTEGYRRLCSRMLEQFRQSKSADDIAILAHTWVLAPQVPADATTVRHLAEQQSSLTLQDPTHKLPSVHILGLAYYRTGLNDKAVECLLKGVKDHPDSEENVFTWLVLAMANQQLNSEEQARQWLDKARQWIEQKNRSRPEKGGGFAPPGWHWRDWMGLRMLQKEAEELLGVRKSKG
jgi:serine/threonine protein kinase/tetratricopeptide (TPR) repeat protein